MGMRGCQFDPQLSRSPPPALTRRDDVRNDVVAEPVRRSMWHAAAIGEPGYSLPRMTSQPLVNGLARHAVNLRQRRNAFTFLVILNHLNTQVHRSVFLPRHCFLACSSGNSEPANLIQLSPMSPD